MSVLDDRLDVRRHFGDGEEQVETQPQADDRERFQNADAQEEEREDVGAGFRLARDRLDGLRRDDTVADGRAEGDGRDDQREADHHHCEDQSIEVT